MYIKLSKRKFRAKIDFYRFVTTFMGIRDELADRRNRTIFEFLEFNEDGEFDIMFLMQLLNNIPRESLFGREIYKLVKKYK